MWLNIHGNKVREDSAEADLFKLLIDDLSTGHVMRQHREKDAFGNFIKVPTRRQHRHPGQAYKSAFDDEKEYELTELGRQFVSYAMNEMVSRIAQASEVPGTEPIPSDPSPGASPTL